MKIIGRSDPGKERQSNEDNFFFRVDGDHAVVAVADGMGGHAAGEVASSLVVDVLSRYVMDASISELCELCADNDIIEFIQKLIDEANYEIFETGRQEADKFGMGTTFTMGFICHNYLVIGHVGDSRVYLISDNKMRRLTNDHSVVEEMLREGKITAEEAKSHPQKNMLTKALGNSLHIDVDIETVHLKEGDALLFCTDGLTSLIEEAEINQMVCDKSASPLEAADDLIMLANDRGGYDNITLVVVTELGG